jgi:rhodanese-related sulfurtransferase
MNSKQVNNALQKLPLEINGSQFRELQAHGSIIVVDVRELGEVPSLTLQNHLQIPMSSFNEHAFDRLAEQNIVLVCQHGIRSLSAAERLQEKFQGAKNIYSLKGGIVRWKL